MKFARDPQCSRCSLGLALQPDWHRQHLCLPTRPWCPPTSQAGTALLVIGKAPGRDEDSQGVSFVGASGRILSDWLTALNLGDSVDIYLTNTVRCRLARDDAPLRQADITACRSFLAQDIAILQQRYPRILLLVLGADASSALGLGSLRDACRCQGQPVVITRTIRTHRLAKNRRIIVVKGPKPTPYRIPSGTKVRTKDGTKKTKVVHCKHEPFDIYVGRPSKWGNPFTHLGTPTRAEVKVDNRAIAVQAYRQWIWGEREVPHRQAPSLEEIRSLKGKTLGCWCKPLACHGDILAGLADRLLPIKGVKKEAKRAKQRKIKVSLPRFLLRKAEIPIATLPAFVTYHPAATLPSRSPALIHPVADHLTLLSRECLRTSSSSASSLSPPHLATPPPRQFPELLGLDIETYGILTTFPEQTVFHPLKSLRVDRIRLPDLVQTVALAWHNTDGVIETTVFIWHRAAHRRLLLSWLRLARAHHATLICFNTLFDLTYLRAVSSDFKAVLSAPLLLEDSAVWNYLQSSVRPEKNLEALSRLFGFIAPAQSRTKKFHRYDRVDDPALLHYNAADAELALKLRHHLRAQLSSPATSEYTRRWFSTLLWSCLGMVEAGVAMDASALEVLHRRCEMKKIQASSFSEQEGFGPLQGKGSITAARKIISFGVELARLDADPRLKRTKVSGLVSTEKDNVQLLLGTLPAETGERKIHQARELAFALTAHRGAVNIIGSYIKPLDAVLAGNSKQALIDGIAYAQCYAIPQTYGESAGSDVEGGTKQARLSFKLPALQTAPAEVRNCYTSRFRPGALLKIDLSQIELRVAALLSGDPRMLDEYARGLDRHRLRAIAFFGESVVDLPDYAAKWRQVGKQGNFWSIYRGGPRVLQETVRRRVGVELSIERCRAFAKQLPDEYGTLWEWQNSLIHEVTRTGYIAEPILGERRWLSQDEFINKTTYESTICNFPVQVAAARFMQDIQADLNHRARAANMHGFIALNVHDALLIDCPLGETGWWKDNFKFSLQSSEYWRRLKAVTERQVPVTYDTTERIFLC